jgi:hypothetical protein
MFAASLDCCRITRITGQSSCPLPANLCEMLTLRRVQRDWTSNAENNPPNCLISELTLSPGALAVSGR